ncbi:MAG: hypothetical protein R3E79_02845 [Caldilineaceae bacterium]
MTETQEILAATHFIVWQTVAGQAPTAIPLVCPKPKALSIDYGFAIRANELHQRLDYRHPFAVIVKCSRPDARLELLCCFRLFLRRSGKVAGERTVVG